MAHGSKFSRGDSAYELLLAAIRHGEIPPGTRVLELDIAERFGISRTPVREALRRLEADGIVVHQPRLGAVVRTLDYQEVVELYDMRVVLEGAAGRMAASHASDFEVKELRALNVAMRSVVTDPIQLTELNRQFHFSLLNAARNRYLIQTMGTLARTLTVLGGTTLFDGPRVATALDEHDAIINAIEARDGDEAEAQQMRHFRGAQQVRLRNFRERMNLHASP